jgi:Flp pilus assembly protein TadG
MRGIWKKFKSFRQEESGLVTVEYVLWFPIMMLVMGLVTDATVLMNQQTLLFDAARDAARQVALGQKTDTEAKNAVIARLGSNKRFGAIVTSSNGYVTATVSVPFNDVLIFGGRFTGGSLAGKVTMWVETSDS